MNSKDIVAIAMWNKNPFVLLTAIKQRWWFLIQVVPEYTL